MRNLIAKVGFWKSLAGSFSNLLVCLFKDFAVEMFGSGVQDAVQDPVEETATSVDGDFAQPVDGDVVDAGHAGRTRASQRDLSFNWVGFDGKIHFRWHWPNPAITGALLNIRNEIKKRKTINRAGLWSMLSIPKYTYYSSKLMTSVSFSMGNLNVWFFGVGDSESPLLWWSLPVNFGLAPSKVSFKSSQTQSDFQGDFVTFSGHTGVSSPEKKMNMTNSNCDVTFNGISFEIEVLISSWTLVTFLLRQVTWLFHHDSWHFRWLWWNGATFRANLDWSLELQAYLCLPENVKPKFINKQHRYIAMHRWRKTQVFVSMSNASLMSGNYKTSILFLE